MLRSKRVSAQFMKRAIFRSIREKCTDSLHNSQIRKILQLFCPFHELGTNKTFPIYEMDNYTLL